MSTIRTVLAATFVLGLSAAAVHAEQPQQPRSAQQEATLDVLLQAIRANREAMVAASLKLNDAEAAAFWPLYERYHKEMNVYGDRLVGVVEDYEANFRTLSNEKALKLIEDYLAIEADRIALRRTYLGEFAKILPGRTVARFYQIENKMDAVIRYDLAATIPVVEEEGAPAK